MAGELCTERMMQCGQDLARALGQAPTAIVQVDEHGWLGLSGERGFADLNMAFVAQTAAASVLEEYVSVIRENGLDAILIVDEGAPELVATGEGLGLVNAGAVPVMEWAGKARPSPTTAYSVRKGTKADIPTANSVAARAFALDEQKLQRVFPPELLDDDGIDFWLVDEGDEALGAGVFVRTGDHAGIYMMSTPPENQRRGVGRAVLDNAMAHYLDAGVTAFTLEATEAGFHLYEQVGFETIGTPRVLLIGESTQFPT